MFEDLIAALQHRRNQVDGREVDAVDRQRFALQQLQGLQPELEAQREQTVAQMLAAGQQQAGEQFRQAGGSMRSGMAGRRLLGSSGHAQQVGQQAAGSNAAMDDAAMQARSWGNERGHQDRQMMHTMAGDALGQLEEGALGHDPQSYQHLLNRMQSGFQADRAREANMRAQGNSTMIGDFLRGPVGGAINYGFDRAHHVNQHQHHGAMRNTLGLPPATGGGAGGNMWQWGG